ncbi:response regulator transcription factor [Flavobacterium sp.]|uniref:response regulator transcription factor n=1 Tax=Flavobacterium sp. TaxID=239 RepID=UPI00286C30D3|nr:response regulator transcription factor [Flavobacterium sp.]
MGTTTIAIIDDHKIVRQGLRELLHRMGNYEVTHEFEDGEEFLNTLPLSSPPQLYVLDYSMPNKNGLEVLALLEKLPDEYKVLLLTQHFDENIINEAYRLGARGFLNKNCTAQELKYAVDTIVAQGYSNISEILRRIKNHQPTVEEVRSTVVLSDRELEFLTLVCDEKEYTYDKMSQIMGISVKTIETYRSSLFERFGIKTKVGLVLFSYKNRLTKPFL